MKKDLESYGIFISQDKPVTFVCVTAAGTVVYAIYGRKEFFRIRCDEPAEVAKLIYTQSKATAYRNLDKEGQTIANHQRHVFRDLYVTSWFIDNTIAVVGVWGSVTIVMEDATKLIMSWSDTHSNIVAHIFRKAGFDDDFVTVADNALVRSGYRLGMWQNQAFVANQERNMVSVPMTRSLRDILEFYNPRDSVWNFMSHPPRAFEIDGQKTGHVRFVVATTTCTVICNDFSEAYQLVESMPAFDYFIGTRAFGIAADKLSSAWSVQGVLWLRFEKQRFATKIPNAPANFIKDNAKRLNRLTTIVPDYIYGNACISSGVLAIYVNDGKLMVNSMVRGEGTYTAPAEVVDLPEEHVQNAFEKFSKSPEGLKFAVKTATFIGSPKWVFKFVVSEGRPHYKFLTNEHLWKIMCDDPSADAIAAFVTEKTPMPFEFGGGITSDEIISGYVEGRDFHWFTAEHGGIRSFDSEVEAINCCRAIKRARSK